MKVAVSFLDSIDIEKTIKEIDNSIADYIHLDLMDGEYVKKNNINSFNINLLKNTNKPIDIHLMVNNPIKYLSLFKDLNVYRITVHINTVNDFTILKNKLKEQNIKLGIAINPNEEINNYLNYLNDIDSVLIMGVYPGKGNQKFIPEIIPKINAIRAINSHLVIGVDGGINKDTIKLLPKVDYIVSGSYIYHSSNYNLAIESLK